MFLILLLSFAFIGATLLVALHYLLYYLSDGRIMLFREHSEPIYNPNRRRTGGKREPQEDDIEKYIKYAQNDTGEFFCDEIGEPGACENFECEFWADCPRMNDGATGSRNEYGPGNVPESFLDDDERRHF